MTANRRNINDLRYLTRNNLIIPNNLDIRRNRTASYWMPIWRVLESDFELFLVNPYAIKQLPGCKSDVKDAEWIATCLTKILF